MIGIQTSADFPPTLIKARDIHPADQQSGALIAHRFEQMLWAQMLSHAGLERAFTQGGGEAASAFTRYLVEAIAADLAERHPLGLGLMAGADDGKGAR